jgi:putative aldouronate transport system substrate-binding protein
MKKILFLLIVSVLVLTLGACGRRNGGNNENGTDGEGLDSGLLNRYGIEIVDIDGEPTFRFKETQPLRVLTWNRQAFERNPSIADSHWGDWIRAEVLRVHNIQVELVEIPRWEPPEGESIAALLAGNMAPDIAYTHEISNFEPFAEMGGILDLMPIVDEYFGLIPNLYALWGMDHLTWNRNPATGESWAFTNIHPDGGTMRSTTFIREDWLNTLNLAVPTTLDEFEAMLIAFRDNARLLLGDDADQMVPFRLTEDVGWTGELIFTSFIPDGITDRDWYVYGWGERRFTIPGVKEGIRLFNRWYNDGLIWQDFPLHTGGDPRGNDLVRLGFVGSMSIGWDNPFREADGLIVQMQENVGPQANFISIPPFPNEAGNRRQFVTHGSDRHIFFPRTNQNIAASMLYLDWLSRNSTREFLMFGPEGITHEKTPEGAFRIIPADDIVDDRWVQQVVRNYDLLFTMGHTILLDDAEIAGLSVAVGYPGVEPWRIMQSHVNNMNYAFQMARPIIPTPQAQADWGSPGLNRTGRAWFNRAVVAPVAEFDAVYDAGLAEFLAAGGQQIIDGRRAAWLAVYGDVDWIPRD